MPYITEDKRKQLMSPIDNLIAALHEQNYDNKIDGSVNFVISSILESIYNREGYDGINRAVGVLECAKLEFYRKVAAPYEDQKEFENGEVYSRCLNI